MKHLYRLIFFIPMMITINLTCIILLATGKDIELLEYDVFDRIKELCDY